MSDQGGGEGATTPTGRIGFEMSDENIAELMRRIEERAQSLQQAAAQRGGQDDGGAERLRAEAKAFMAGRSREDLPDGWWELAMPIAHEQDPEYPEWLRLKERFGG